MCRRRLHRRRRCRAFALALVCALRREKSLVACHTGLVAVAGCLGFGMVASLVAVVWVWLLSLVVVTLRSEATIPS